MELVTTMPYQGDNLISVKRGNRSAALGILHEKGAMSRKRLAEHMNLTPAAITKIVGEMIDEGLLLEGEVLQSSGAGRREILIDLNPEAAVALGVLINLRQAIVSAVRLDGSVIFAEESGLPERADADETVECLAGRLNELTRENRIDDGCIIGVGIAVRGICASDGRTVVNSFGALDRENYPLCDRFEEATGRPCFMANNVRALFAAHCFSAREAEGHSQFFLRCEYGIGASLSIDGKIWHGVTEQCAEIGHIPVVRRGGKPCSCGKSGCLETIASPTAIREDAMKLLSEEDTPILWNLKQKKDGDALQLTDVFAAAKNGDARVAELVDRAASALAMALKSVIYLVDPEKIVLYGKMFEDSYYLSRLLAEMQEGVDGGHAVSVEKSRFNQQLETKAAGLVAVEAFFRSGGIPA
jgi:predicted NBD/HSP70 family sugar kinase